MSLGVLYLVARVLTPSNEDDVLACIRAKTESEAESILAEFGGPAPKIRERVVRIASTERPPLPSTLTLYDQQDGAKAARPTSASGTIVLGEAARTGGAAAAAGTATAGGAAASGGTAAAVAGTATAGEAAASGGTAAAGCADTAGSVPHLSETPESALGSTQEPSNGSPLGSSAPKTTSSSPPQTPEQGSARHLPASPATRPREEYRLVAVIDDQTRRKLERALALRSRGQAKPASIAETLGAALDRYLSENCPIERDKRRRARKEQQEAKRSGATHSSGTETDSNAAPPDTRHSAASSRPYIPIAVRDAVVARDEGRCTFVGPEGRRCTATDDLDLDHRLPIALGGSSSIDNLRVLCRRHNQREADRLLGQAFMDQRRTEGRTQSQSETRPEPQLVDR